MYKKESCHEKIKTEKDKNRLFRMQERTGLACDKVKPNFSSLKLARFTSRPPFLTSHLPFSASRSLFVACVVRLSKVTSMIRECRLDGVWPVIAVLVLMVAWVGGSEFPERECCDPVYPQNTVTTAAAPPVTPPVQTSIKLAGEFSFSIFLGLHFCVLTN